LYNETTWRNQILDEWFSRDLWDGSSQMKTRILILLSGLSVFFSIHEKISSDQKRET